MNGALTPIAFAAIFSLGAAAQAAAQAPQPAASSNPFQHISFGLTLEGYSQFHWNHPHVMTAVNIQHIESLNDELALRAVGAQPMGTPVVRSHAELFPQRRA